MLTFVHVLDDDVLDAPTDDTTLTWVDFDEPDCGWAAQSGTKIKSWQTHRVQVPLGLLTIPLPGEDGER